MTMHARRPGARPTVLVLCLALLLAVCWSATALGARDSSAGRLGKTWAGTYNGTYTGSFTIHWTLRGSKLYGTIALSNPKGTYGITGSVAGSAIHFGAVGAGATYTGSMARGGKSMSGNYATGRGGGSWSARKTS